MLPCGCAAPNFTTEYIRRCRMVKYAFQTVANQVDLAGVAI